MNYPAEKKDAFKARLLPLLQVYSPSGNEGPLLDVLAEQAKPFCEEVFEDKFGNIICHVGGRGKKLMICAHADEIGFIIKSISKEGFLYFQKVGGTPEKQMEARQVMVNGNIPGIIGCKAGHLMTAEEMMKITPPKELFIDIGVSSREEAEALGVEIGSYASQKFNYMEMHNADLMCCRSLDDRAGCALLLELMKNVDKEKLCYDLYIVFTLQEETGLRGAQAAANFLEPDYGISVDTVPCADTPGMTYQRDLPLELGKGFCLSINESRVAFASPVMVRHIKKLAKENGIPFQLAATSGYAGTDASAISVGGRGAKVATLTIPRRYSHSAVELMNVNDAVALGEMLMTFVTNEI